MQSWSWLRDPEMSTCFISSPSLPSPHFLLLLYPHLPCFTHPLSPLGSTFFYVLSSFLLSAVTITPWEGSREAQLETKAAFHNPSLATPRKKRLFPPVKVLLVSGAKSWTELITLPLMSESPPVNLRTLSRLLYPNFSPFHS